MILCPLGIIHQTVCATVVSFHENLSSIWVCLARCLQPHLTCSSGYLLPNISKKNPLKQRL